MTYTEQIRKIVNRLLDLTREDKIEWRLYTDDDKSFVYNNGKHRYRISIEDSTIHFASSDILPTFPSNYIFEIFSCNMNKLYLKYKSKAGDGILADLVCIHWMAKSKSCKDEDGYIFDILLNINANNPFGQHDFYREEVSKIFVIKSDTAVPVINYLTNHVDDYIWRISDIPSIKAKSYSIVKGSYIYTITRFSEDDNYSFTIKDASNTINICRFECDNSRLKGLFEAARIANAKHIGEIRDAIMDEIIYTD